MKATYQALYDGQSYREFSPGEMLLPDFFKRVPLAPDDVVLDFGCGTARATASIAKRCKAIGIDFVRAVETDVEFLEHDLRKPCPVKGTKGYCADVMEHIATRSVTRVLRNIMAAVDTCYFAIATVPDRFGGGSLHLTVRPFGWWASKLCAFGTIRYAREEPERSIFVVQRSRVFRELEKRMELTATEAEIEANIRANLDAGYEEVSPKETQETEVALLAGGPSLAEFSGFPGPIITVNGAYNWAIERGYKVAAQIVVDAREWNKRFVAPVVPGCRYLLASQCHPGVVSAVPREQLWLWHSGLAAKNAIECWAREKGVERAFFPVFGGSTVVLSGIALLMMLGLRKFHIYGFDSCLVEGAHHAYAQPENDCERVMDVVVGGRTFRCHHWMVAQAQEFIDMVKYVMPEDAALEVHGAGLIAHILKTGAHYFEQGG